jgi:hypothetical protein
MVPTQAASTMPSVAWSGPRAVTGGLPQLIVKAHTSQITCLEKGP